jgi:hypothetical protein
MRMVTASQLGTMEVTAGVRIKSVMRETDTKMGIEASIMELKGRVG